jgi:hypothetical protein
MEKDVLEKVLAEHKLWLRGEGVKGADLQRGRPRLFMPPFELRRFRLEY